MAKLPEKIEDWTEAPWEKEGAGEFDPARAKELVFNISKNLEREQDAHSATKAAREAADADKAALEVKVTALEADTSVDDLKRENAQLKQDAESARQSARKTMLDAVKGEFNLTDRQVAKLDGDDLEALRLDARETFGDPKPAGDGEPEAGGDGGGQQEQQRHVGTQPQRLHNPGSPNDGGTPNLPSRDEVLASIKD